MEKMIYDVSVKQLSEMALQMILREALFDNKDVEAMYMEYASDPKRTNQRAEVTKRVYQMWRTLYPMLLQEKDEIASEKGIKEVCDLIQPNCLMGGLALDMKEDCDYLIEEEKSAYTKSLSVLRALCSEDSIKF